jgi:hypothetical protein
MTSSYKYTDRQVAEDPEMYGRIATEYCRDYTGSFHVLVEYRERIAAGYPLNLMMVRTVLNCMLHDARVVDLPAPRYEPVSYKNHSGRVSFTDEDEDDEVQPVYREQYVKMPVRWKHDYGMSTSPRAYVIHRVHPDSHALWNTVNHTPHMVMWWRCKSGYWSMSAKVPARLLGSDEAHQLVESGATIADKRIKFCAVCEVHSG